MDLVSMLQDCRYYVNGPVSIKNWSNLTYKRMIVTKYVTITKETNLPKIKSMMSRYGRHNCVNKHGTENH